MKLSLLTLVLIAAAATLSTPSACAELSLVCDL